MKEVIYNNLQRWIPPSDVDGVDLKPEIASTARNIIFQNGFFKNAVDTVNKVLPTNAQAFIEDGYQLIGYTNFNHSTQGFHEVYVIYLASENKLYIFLDNEVVTVDDSLAYIICLDTPHHINFALVNDQLKINLNVKAIILTKEVVLNLSLEWIDEKVYITGTPPSVDIVFTGTGANDLSVTIADGTPVWHRLQVEIVDTDLWDSFRYRILTALGNPPYSEYMTIIPNQIYSDGNFSWSFPSDTGHIIFDRWEAHRIESIVEYVKPAGWMVKPRWLGWLMKDHLSIRLDGNQFTPVIEQFEDTTYPSNFHFDIGVNPYPTLGWVRTAVDGFEKGFALVLNPTYPLAITFVQKRIWFSQTRNIKSCKIEYRLRGNSSIKVMVEPFLDDDRMVFSDNHVQGELVETRTATIDVGEISRNGGSLVIYGLTNFISTGGDDNVSMVEVGTFEITPAETMLIGLFDGGQRGLINTGRGEELIGISLFYNSLSDLQLYLNMYSIDWRLKEIEVYAKSSLDNNYYLKGTVQLGEGAWLRDGDNFYANVVLVDVDDAVETLNFNYGLGEGVRVDTQHLIYNEASFNNRVYAVNGGYRILQTHIAGNGRIQPDAFPYDEDDFLGFIEESKSSLIQSLFIINNNFLMIYMTNGYSLYQINSSPYTGRLQKELRMLASSFTGFNPKSLTRMINATSPTIGAYWVTNEGIWYHDGSLGSVPINLITDTHRNYWKTVEKTNFGFYDYQDNEYWYATKVYNESNDDHEGREFTEFIIYEINFKTFRFVRLEKAYYELAGYVDGKPLLRTNTAIGTLDKSNNKSLNGLIETHWNDLGNEYYNKIAQAISIQLKQSYADGVIYLKAQFDDQTLVYSFEVSTNEKEIIRMFPESVRFKSVRLSVLLYNLDLSEISASSFKLVYTEDGIGRFGEFFDHQVIVEGGGYGKAYGRYYGGSNPAGAGGGFGTQYGKHYGN